MSRPIRVLIVEDSPTVRGRLREVLAEDPHLDIAGEAGDGAHAVELCRRVRPDVITMDLMLPVMSGLDATEQIMGHWPTPILVVSSSTNRAEVYTTYDALAAGAVDVFEKPLGDRSDIGWEQRLRSAVKLVSRIPVITHPRARLRNHTVPVHHPPPDHRPPPAAGAPKRCDVVAIGASTGGPGAVVEVLRALPAKYPIPILLVQHISAPFTAAFAEWLGGQVRRDVACARDGELIAAAGGRVLLAPPDQHLTVRGGRVRLTSDAERHSCRPSIDVLFESLVREYSAGVAACLLTGMGHDGAIGLLALRRAGAVTLAQDEATSVVYGMPRQAALLDAAGQILPPAGIGERLAGLASSHAPAHRPARKP